MSSDVDFGSPVADIEHYLKSEPGEDPTPAAAAAPVDDRPARHRSRRLALIAALVIIAFAIGGVLWSLRPAAARPDDPAPVPPAGITGFAELFVATYLTGAGDGAAGVLADFMVESGAVAAMTPLDRYVPRAATIAVERLGTDYWDVTVAAEVLERTAAGYVAAGIEHYRVAVVGSEGQFVVAALPARVAGPPAQIQPPLPTLADEATNSITALATEFLDALLVGSHRLSRYTVPGSTIRALDPHPYQAISIVSITTGIANGRTYVATTVEAATPAGSVHVLGYTLELASDGGGQWEVAAILPGPPPPRIAAP